MNVGSPDRLAVPRSVVATVREREVTFLAAGISYYILVSLVPLLTLALVVATFLGGSELAVQVQSIAQRYLLPAGSDLVANALEDPTGRGTLSAVSLLISTWGALKLFRGVDVAFSRIYGYPPESILDQLSDGVVALVALGIATVGVATAAAAMALFEIPYVEVVSPVVLLAFLVAAFVPLYTIIPDVRVTPREALPGALFTAVGWTVLGAGFGAYARFSSGVAGALGAVLLLVTWFYLSGILVLVGAVLNAVLAGEIGVTDRQLQHPRGRYTERTMSADDVTTPDDTQVPPGGARDDTDVDPRGAPDIEQLDRRVEELRSDLDAFEDDIRSRTVERPDVEADMRRYVRGQLRRGKARGWGPYLVLLYGTTATIAAFYLLEDDLLAVVAMLVIYLSTLGLYALFVVFGVGLNALGVPGRLVDWVRDRRS